MNLMNAPLAAAEVSPRAECPTNHGLSFSARRTRQYYLGISIKPRLIKPESSVDKGWVLSDNRGNRRAVWEVRQEADFRYYACLFSHTYKGKCIHVWAMMLAFV